MHSRTFFCQEGRSGTDTDYQTGYKYLVVNDLVDRYAASSSHVLSMGSCAFAVKRIEIAKRGQHLLAKTMSNLNGSTKAKLACVAEPF